MSYHLGNNGLTTPSAQSPGETPATSAPPVPAVRTYNRWYKVTPAVLEWFRSRFHSNQAIANEIIQRAPVELVYVGYSTGGGVLAFRREDGSRGEIQGTFSDPPANIAPQMTQAEVDAVFASTESSGASTKTRHRVPEDESKKAALYTGVSVIALAILGLGAWAIGKRGKQAKPIQANDYSKPRFPIRWGSLERALNSKTDRGTMTAEEMEEFDRADRVALTEEELALVEGVKDALYARISEAHERWRFGNIRALAEAQSIAEDIENHPDYTGVVGCEGDALGGIADEYDGNIPESVLESFLSISKRAPEVQASLRDMVEIAELVSRVCRIVGLIADNERGTLTSEQYELLMRIVGRRIEANRSTVYAIPERRAYPITTAKDAYHATQRLKQGRVKSEEDARRIISAIKREHHGIWSEYLKDYPVSRIMTSKRKGLSARRRK